MSFDFETGALGSARRANYDSLAGLRANSLSLPVHYSIFLSWSLNGGHLALTVSQVPDFKIISVMLSKIPLTFLS
jgi:hypothetical protein